MKPATYWRDIFCNRFIVNTKEADVIVKFIEEIQKDARSDDSSFDWDALQKIRKESP